MRDCLYLALTFSEFTSLVQVSICTQCCPLELFYNEWACCVKFDFFLPQCSEGTPAPLVITLLNGSPRVSGDSVTAEFSTNKNVTMMQCRLGRGVTEFEDCEFA